MHYYIGLTQWHHPDWYKALPNLDSKDSLKTYSNYFSTVEGNNTFYGLPNESNIEKWCDDVSNNFRFCFKFPKAISHDASLQHCETDVKEFLKRVSPLQDKLGILWLQMNQSFSPAQLPVLQTFLDCLPSDFTYGIEVRHLGFYNKADNEKAFNRLLMEYKINRVMFDTRSLFSHSANDPETLDALRKKPRVPAHVLATGNNPMVRFISPMDTNLSTNDLQQWATKIIQWIDEGRTPYVFFHTPDNAQAPQLAERFSKTVNTIRPDISEISLWPQKPEQSDLF